jgi:sugar/nucleoside kinase (ribokinase family)
MSVLEDVFLDLDRPVPGSFEVIGFGENAVDWVCSVSTFPPHDSKVKMDSMSRMGGGTIATACSLLARWGLRTRYVGRVGEDEAGDFALKSLAEEALDLAIEVVTGASSHFSVIIVDQATGKRTIIWDRDPRLAYRADELPLRKLLQTRVLLLDTCDSKASLEVLRHPGAARTFTVLDIDRVTTETEALLSLVRVALPNLSFVKEFTGSSDWRNGLRKMGEICPGLVGVTLGEEGSALLWEDQIYEFSGFPVEVVDSTSAGDVFHGAFIFAILNEWSLARCMRFANAAGALTCCRLGARASIPALEEVLGMEKGETV